MTQLTHPAHTAGVHTEGFSASVQEQIGAYVYALRSPVNGQIFYVGKGKGDRVFAHARGALVDTEPSLKYDVIREIIARGLKVEAWIVQHGLEDDGSAIETSHAHQTESAIYGILNLLDPTLDNTSFRLTNLVAPPSYREFGLRSAEDLIAQYGSPADLSLFPHQSLLIKPSSTWSLGMSTEALYEVTRGWWRLDHKRVATIRYVFSIPRSVVRAVYEVPQGGWRAQREGDHGWGTAKLGVTLRGFDGIDVSNQFSELMNKSVDCLFQKKQSNRTNVRYLDDREARHRKKLGLVPFWAYPHAT